MTKHKLVRNITMIGAVVVSASFLFNSCSNEEIDKFLAFSETNNDVFVEQMVDDIYNRDFKDEQNKFMFNLLLKKHFAKKDQSNISLSEIKINGEKKYILKLQEISSSKSIPEFINKLSKYYNISILQIDNSTLWQLDDFDFSYINTLIIESDTKGVGMCDLSNFECIDNLVLRNVRAINIPKSIQSISFDGTNNSTYIIDELDNLKNLTNLKSIIFKNLTLNNITIPESKEFLIEITNCNGYVKINVLNSDKVYIDNCNNDEFNCFIEVGGTINEELNAYSSFNNVVAGNINGNPSLNITIKNGEDEITKPIDDVDTLKLKLQKNS